MSNFNKLIADVKITHHHTQADQFDYKICNNTRFTVRFDGKSTLANIHDMTEKAIKPGQTGSGKVTILGPELLGDDFLNETRIPIEVSGVVIAHCEIISKEIVYK